jgi:hypothetical protein
MSYKKIGAGIRPVKKASMTDFQMEYWLILDGKWQSISSSLRFIYAQMYT